jgi:DNA-binding NarL/FixJ family response regulator
MKLMIVDDHAVYRHLIRQVASTRHDTVLECVSADDALKSVAVFRPDCVTMDVRMPGSDAFDAIRHIRQFYPGTRVLVVTAYDQEDFRRAATEAGAAAFISKENLSELYLLAAPQRLHGSPPQRAGNN